MRKIMTKPEAIERLIEIVDAATALSNQARDIIKEHFPSELSHADAYGVFNFAHSNNPHDVTLESVVAHFEEHDEDDEY